MTDIGHTVSTRNFDSGIGERVGKIEIKSYEDYAEPAPERPVSSQLSRIEQAVTAALEGQARLNALVDGVTKQIEVNDRAQGIDSLAHWESIMHRLAAIDKKLDIFAENQANVCKAIDIVFIRLAAIEAKLETLSASKLTRAANAALHSFQQLPKAERARRRKQIKSLSGKKPSHKARRAKRST